MSRQIWIHTWKDFQRLAFWLLLGATVLTMTVPIAYVTLYVPSAHIPASLPPRQMTKPIGVIVNTSKTVIQIPNATTWLVVDATGGGCDDVTALVPDIHDDWRVALVTDTQRRWSDCRYPQCVLLNENTFGPLAGSFSTSKHLGKPNKLSGFLLAMTLGAKVIVDVTCSTGPKVNMKRHPLLNGPEVPWSSLFYNDSTLFNAFQHFGYEGAYPRIFRLVTSQAGSNMPNGTDCPDHETECRRVHTNSERYYVTDLNIDGFIRQSVSPLYSSCGKEACPPHSSHNEGGDFTSPPVSVGYNTLAPLDTGLTSFPANAFLWMFVPVSLPGKFQEVFRTVFVHMMRFHLLKPLHYVHDEMHVNNVSCILMDDEDSRMISVDLDRLTRMVPCQRCLNDNDGKNTRSFAVDLLRRTLASIVDPNTKIQLYNEKDVISDYLAWLKDVERFESTRVTSKFQSLKHQNPFMKHTFKLKYSIQPTRFYNEKAKEYMHVLKSSYDNKSICAGSPRKPHLSAANWESSRINDILLIVVINYEFLFGTLPYLEHIHRPFFKHIVYCGPNVGEFQTFAKKNGFSYVTFIEGLQNDWIFMYECMASAMKLGLPVKGYLQIGEDLLLNTRRIATLPRDKIWIPKVLTKIAIETKSIEWIHWPRAVGRLSMVGVFRELEAIERANYTGTSVCKPQWADSRDICPFAKTFLTNYDNNFGRRFVSHRAVDVFYMPGSLRGDFLLASAMFRHHKAIHELALPVMSLGLTIGSDVIYLQGKSLWGEERYYPWALYDEREEFLHPFKSLSHFQFEKGKEFFCNKFLYGQLHHQEDTP